MNYGAMWKRRYNGIEMYQKQAPCVQHPEIKVTHSFFTIVVVVILRNMNEKAEKTFKKWCSIPTERINGRNRRESINNSLFFFGELSA